jgi:hypothetical protein
MGAYLSSPVTDKSTDEGSHDTANLEYAVVSMQVRRREEKRESTCAMEKRNAASGLALRAAARLPGRPRAGCARLAALWTRTTPS